MTERPVCTETDSRDCRDLAEIAVPAREEQIHALLDIIPFERAGLSLVDCHWMGAGHAIYGGYC